MIKSFLNRYRKSYLQIADRTLSKDRKRFFRKFHFIIKFDADVRLNYYYIFKKLEYLDIIFYAFYIFFSS